MDYQSMINGMPISKRVYKRTNLLKFIEVSAKVIKLFGNPSFFAHDWTFVKCISILLVE